MQLGKWHVGDKLENFPTSNGFDERYDMLPYYAGVYAYVDKELHPSFPTHDKSFMALWDQVDLSQWDGKAGAAPTAVKKDFTYADLATGDDEMRAKAIDWLKAHAKDQNPFFMYLCFLKVHNPNNPSPRWKGKSPGGGNYLDAPGARRQLPGKSCRPSATSASIRIRSWCGPPTTAPGSTLGRMRVTRLSAA